MKFNLTTLLFLSLSFFLKISGQYEPKNLNAQQKKEAKEWVDQTYNSLTLDQKLGQLFIVALYTNKDENHINEIRKLVENEQIGGLILMQDDAAREIKLVNEFQKIAKVPMLIGMDAEWGIYQRIAKAHKYPWAMTLGAIQDKKLIYEMATKIAEDCKRMGINWNFAPVVDVNTNPNNPIIGNRSFGSEVKNVIASAMAYANGLQDQNILAAIKHFPGHGDTNTDSHLDLPVVSHSIKRLNEVELAPFKALMNKQIGGVMVAHLYVPSLEPQKGIPASISKPIITHLLKEKYGYKGLIITDALNMGAVAKKYQPGELDALAFAAGNDIMLFSQGVNEGKKRILKAIESGEIAKERIEESVKKILLTKYYLGLKEYSNKNPENIAVDINNKSHEAIVQKMYSNAITLVKNNDNSLPISCKKTYFYLPLEEASYSDFSNLMNTKTTLILKKENEINTIPKGATIIIGLHKDNATAYKPYKISDQSKKTIAQLSKNNKVILVVFGSPYALKDMDISEISTVVISYENNKDSMTATAKALLGETILHGRLPVLVNKDLPEGKGITLDKTTK